MLCSGNFVVVCMKMKVVSMQDVIEKINITVMQKSSIYQTKCIVIIVKACNDGITQ